jgi:uncharacterized oligopeptide transporter (OPT) family protein
MPELFLREQIEVKRRVIILEERPLPPVTALADMVRDAGEDETGEASHGLKLGECGGCVNNLGIYARVTVILSAR